MEEVLARRAEQRRRAVEEARRFASCARKVLGDVTVVLYGSYARGDFNEWSDIDVLVVSRKSLPRNPLERLNLLEECLHTSPCVEALVLTEEEALRMTSKRNPALEEALTRGVVLIDDLDLVKRARRILGRER